MTGNRNMANRPSESNKQYVTRKDGTKVRNTAFVPNGRFGSDDTRNERAGRSDIMNQVNNDTREAFPGGANRILAVAGTTFVERGLFERITPDTEIRLEAEPDNKFDKNAVRVMAWDSTNKEFAKVGYVPANLAKKFNFMETPSGTVDEVYPATSGRSPGLRFSLFDPEEEVQL